jgi:hyaluronoglucosaminidase
MAGLEWSRQMVTRKRAVVGWAALPTAVGAGSLALVVMMGSAGFGGRTVPSMVSIPARAGTVTVYVANILGNTVTPIRAGSSKSGRPIRVGRGPGQIVISPDGRTAYVAADPDAPGQASPATLTAIGTAANKPGKTLTVCRTGHGGAVMAISPDGKTVYFACAEAGVVVPVRTRPLTLGTPIRVRYPSAIAITPDGKTVYVANGDGDTITPIRTATGKPGTPIKVGAGSAAIAITPDGATAYVATYNGLVTPVRTATNKPGKPIRIEGAFAIAITPDGATAYVLSTPDPDSSQGYVVPIRVATDARSTPIRVGMLPVQIAISPDGKMAYVSNGGSGTVTPIRVAAGRAGKAIRAGTAPAELAITPDGKTVYVVDSNPFGASGSVIPIRVATNTAGKPITVGRFPFDIAIAP